MECRSLSLIICPVSVALFSAAVLLLPLLLLLLLLLMMIPGTCVFLCVWSSYPAVV